MPLQGKKVWLTFMGSDDAPALYLFQIRLSHIPSALKKYKKAKGSIPWKNKSMCPFPCKRRDTRLRKDKSSCYPFAAIIFCCARDTGKGHKRDTSLYPFLCFFCFFCLPLGAIKFQKGITFLFALKGTIIGIRRCFYYAFFFYTFLKIFYLITC